MKVMILFLIYILAFMVFFFILSAIGMLWGYSYQQCIGNKFWFFMYSVTLGSWMAYLCAREYYVYEEEYFGDVFETE